MELLVSAESIELNADDLLLFDCRAHLGNLQQGRKDYESGHIPGAQHADLDADLSSPPGSGGRHPLPQREALAQRCRDWGINNESRVICYDQNSGAFAARLWWLLRWLGHDNVCVLDGGLDAWLQAGRPLETRKPQVPQGNFQQREPLTRTCELDRVLDPGHRLLDARDAARFRGEVEPIDPVAGHIPGAMCAPFADNLSGGRFKSPEQLKERFTRLSLNPGEDLVCYCGSGVTAIHNILALLLAGYEEPALYPGSWSEWIVDPDRPIETVE